MPSLPRFGALSRDVWPSSFGRHPFRYSAGTAVAATVSTVGIARRSLAGLTKRSRESSSRSDAGPSACGKGLTVPNHSLRIGSSLSAEERGSPPVSPRASGQRGIAARSVALAALLALGVACSRTTPTTPRAASTYIAAVVGSEAPVTTFDASWNTYSSASLGLAYRYPESWHEQDCPSGSCLYPPGSSSSSPSPAITFTLLVNQPYDPTARPPTGMGKPQPVSVAGLTGQAFQSVSFDIPTEGYLIELPFRGTTLAISASLGPVVDLVPQLDAMLPTLKLTP